MPAGGTDPKQPMTVPSPNNHFGTRVPLLPRIASWWPPETGQVRVHVKSRAFDQPPGIEPDKATQRDQLRDRCVGSLLDAPQPETAAGSARHDRGDGHHGSESGSPKPGADGPSHPR